MPMMEVRVVRMPVHDADVPMPMSMRFAGRVAGALIRRVEPLMGVAPMKEPPSQPFPIIARLGYGADADKTGKE